MIRENSVTGVELSQQSMEGKAYNSVIKQLQFLTNNDTSPRKQMKEMMK